MANEVIPVKEFIRRGTEHVHISEGFVYEDLATIGPVEVDLDVYRQTMGMSVKGYFKAQLEEPCDRCFESFTRAIHQSFEENYVFDTMISSMAGGEIELEGKDLYEPLDPNGVLDLKDLIYQLIILHSTSNRFCHREDCRNAFS